MVPVFSRAPSKPCSKTIDRMVLVAIVALPRSVAPGDWPGASERLWSAWRNGAGMLRRRRRPAWPS